MATNQVLLPCQIVPNLWGSCRGLLEGLSLLGPPSCSASWPASLVERVTAIPACQNVPGSSKTPTKSNLPPPRVAKTTPDSGKKPHHPAKKAAGLFWKDDAKGKEDAEARKLEEKCWKKSTGPMISLGDHKESISNLLKRAPHVGFPSLPARPQVLVRNTRKRPKENMSPAISQMMIRCLTGLTSLEPKIASETPPQT